MNDIHFACTVLKMKDKDGNERTYRAGDVVRVEKAHDAWSDCLILGFSEPSNYGDVYVRLSRPYAYVSCVGTICPGVLLGAEEFSISASKLVEETVVSASPFISQGHIPRNPSPSEVIDMTGKTCTYKGALAECPDVNCPVHK